MNALRRYIETNGMNMASAAPRFDPTFSWGHVGVILSIAVSAITVYTNFSNEIAENRKFRDAYGPLLQSMITVDKLHDERISNILINLTELQKQVDSMREMVDRNTEAVNMIRGLNQFQKRPPGGQQ